MNITSKSIEKGFGENEPNSNHKHRQPQPVREFKVKTPKGTTIVTVYAKNHPDKEPDHITIQKIEETPHTETNLNWNSLTHNEQEEIREHLAEKVKDDYWFKNGYLNNE